MKRFLSLLLCAALLASVGLVSAFAEEPADKEEALIEIASYVKGLLEIDDSFTSFQGDYNDGLRPGWYLYWSREGLSISVDCDVDGLVTDYSRWDNERGDSFYGFKPAMPAIKLEEAQKAAEDWLERLLNEEETARIDSHWGSMSRDGGYSFSGRILKNGLESPVTFRIYIDSKGLETYYRSDSYRGYVGELPSPEPSTDEQTAAAALAGETVLDIYYVRGDDGEARLRYVPIGPRIVVDAQTGEAVDMDALYASVDAWYEEPAAAEEMKVMDAGTGYGRAMLTEVELSSIANYADVLPEETLDEIARGFQQLGLDDFKFGRCSYTMDGEEITAHLTYAVEMGPDRLFGFAQEDYDDYMSWSSTRAVVDKSITMNAKTGELINVSTSYPIWRDRITESDDMGEDIAEAFLTAAAPERFADTLFTEGSSGYGSSDLTYTRVHEGYTYPVNYIHLALNMSTGTVDDYYCVWDDDVTFAASEGIVTHDDALEIYANAQTVTLGYAAWPEGVDYNDPVYDVFIRWGYNWVESLRLGWYYSNSALQGVDALTGELITDPTAEPIVYDDIDETPEADVILELADAGIGFTGGSFQPAAALTQRDAVVLCLQAEGNSAASWDDDTLRQEALWQGFVKADGWEPDRELTRMEFIRMILDASIYSAAVRLEGVWADSFAIVETGDTGYAAVAAALGMAEGKELYGTCTRADAATMLYAFMTR